MRERRPRIVFGQNQSVSLVFMVHAWWVIGYCYSKYLYRAPTTSAATVPRRVAPKLPAARLLAVSNIISNRGPGIRVGTLKLIAFGLSRDNATAKL